jgi:hypothetical protein
VQREEHHVTGVRSGCDRCAIDGDVWEVRSQERWQAAWTTRVSEKQGQLLDRNHSTLTNWTVRQDKIGQLCHTNGPSVVNITCSILLNWWNSSTILAFFSGRVDLKTQICTDPDFLELCVDVCHILHLTPQIAPIEGNWWSGDYKLGDGYEFGSFLIPICIEMVSGNRAKCQVNCYSVFGWDVLVTGDDSVSLSIFWVSSGVRSYFSTLWSQE